MCFRMRCSINSVGRRYFSRYLDTPPFCNRPFILLAADSGAWIEMRANVQCTVQLNFAFTRGNQRTFTFSTFCDQFALLPSFGTI